jgi:hypothetical protein
MIPNCFSDLKMLLKYILLALFVEQLYGQGLDDNLFGIFNTDFKKDELTTMAPPLQTEPNPALNKGSYKVF